MMKQNWVEKLKNFGWLPAAITESAAWKKYGRFGWAVVVILLVSLYVVFCVQRPDAEVWSVEKGTATSAVYGTVNVTPMSEVIVRARATGQVSQMMVKPGDVVKKGQPLIEVVDDFLKRTLSDSNEELKRAKAKHALGPASKSMWEAKVAEVGKIKKLFEAANIAQIEFDRVSSEEKTLRQQVETEKLALDAELNLAEQKCRELSEQSNQMVSQSPIDGVVLEVFCHIGDSVLPQAQLIRVGTANNHIIGMVIEEDVGKLQKGMKGIIRLFAHPGKNFSGVLTEILPQADGQSYKVIFILEDPPANLLPGMSGEMNVIVGERRDSMIIPSRAIRKGNEVMAVIGSTVKVCRVEIGYKCLEKTEILRGLEPDMLVILSGQENFHDGQWVRPCKSQTPFPKEFQ